MRLYLTTLAAALAASTASAQAEFQFSAYGGYQSAPHSDVTVTGNNPANFTAGWDGKSFSPPAYWGVRATWWMDFAPKWGVSLDYSHSKVYADQDTFNNKTPAAQNWQRFEFSDGLNTATVNALRRFEPINRFEPYVGAGVGIVVPHVEVTRNSGQTFEFQVGGASFQAQAGVNYKLTERFSLFGEYKINYSMVDVTIDGGDKLKTNIITNAFNAGVSVHF